MTSNVVGGSAVPVVSPDVSLAVLDGEVVVHHFTTNRFLRLDRIGSLTWQCFDGSSTVDEIVGDLADAFEVDPSIVRADVETLLGELTTSGVVELIDSPGSPTPSSTTVAAPTHPTTLRSC